MPSSLLAPGADTVSLPSRSAVWIEIHRGKTQFPRRPVLGERFLIGAGSNCHLQLGGQGMPFLHSVLLVQGNQVTLEAFVPWPELQLNGTPVQSVTLLDGDRVSIGPFEFQVQIESYTAAADPDDLYAKVPLSVAQEAEAEENLKELSVAELIEKIEDAEEDVAAFDDSRQAGAAALLDAAWLAGETSPGSAEELPEVRLLHDLNRLADEIQQRLEVLKQRDAVQLQRADEVLAVQDRLAEQLKRVAESMTAGEDEFRATA